MNKSHCIVGDDARLAPVVGTGAFGQSARKYRPRSSCATSGAVVAGVAAILLGTARPVRAGIAVAPPENTFARFTLIAAADGGGPADGLSSDIEVEAPPAFTQFNPNDATGTLSNTGQNGSATGSAAGAAFTNYSIANDVLTVHCTVAFNTSDNFVSGPSHGSLGGGVGTGLFSLELPVQITGGLYEYDYSIQVGHDLLGTASQVFGNFNFSGAGADFINLTVRNHTGSGTTTASDSGVVAPTLSGGLGVDFEVESSAGPGDPTPHHANGTADVQLTLRPANKWKNPAGGSFQTAGNWTGNLVPGPGDVAVFDLPGTYSVQLDQPVTNATLTGRGSGVNVTFDVAGHPYTLNKIQVGGNPGDNVHFSFIDSGGIVTAARGRAASTPPPITLSVPGSFNVGTGGQVDIGGETSSGAVFVNNGGILSVLGADADWTVQTLLLGTSGAATLSVSNTATVTTSFANLGVGATGNATATVSHANWDNDQLIVGGQGTGTLRALNNTFVTVGNLIVGAQAGSSGTITVDSANNSNTLGFFSLPNATASAVIGDGGAGHLVVQNKGIFVVNSGTLTLGRTGGGTGDATVTGADSLLSAETLVVGALGTGSITATQGGLLAASSHGVGKAVIGNNGTLHLTSGGLLHAQTSLQVDGQLSIDSASEGDVGDDSLITSHVPGRLFIAPGGTLLGAGTIAVNRVVMLGGNNSFAGGILKPGHSPGTLTINGDLEQDPGSTIKIEIAGTDPSQFDVLNVTGNASFAGDLLLSFQDGFAPRQGDTFAFLNTAGTMTGSFANVHLHDLAPGFQFNLQPETGGTVALVALNDGISTRIPGDANDDGKVDFSDLLILAQNFNQDGTYSTGDFNLDGSVDFNDLLLLAQHFGQISADQVEQAFVAVPEPSFVFAAPFALAVLRRVRRESKSVHTANK